MNHGFYFQADDGNRRPYDRPQMPAITAFPVVRELANFWELPKIPWKESLLQQGHFWDKEAQKRFFFWFEILL